MIKVGGNLVSIDIIRKDIEKLNFLVIYHAIDKFKEDSSEKEIESAVIYLKSCIYNAIHEMSFDTDNEFRCLDGIY